MSYVKNVTQNQPRSGKVRGTSCRCPSHDPGTSVARWCRCTVRCPAHDRHLLRRSVSSARPHDAPPRNPLGCIPGSARP